MPKRNRRQPTPADVPRVEITVRVGAGEEFRVEIISNSMDASTVAQIAQSTLQGIVTQNAIVPTSAASPSPLKQSIVEVSTDRWLRIGGVALIKWIASILTALLIAYIIYRLRWN